MKKLKKTVWFLAIIGVVLVVAAIIVISVFLGDIVKKGVETVGPQITRVSIKLDVVHLSLWTGAASVRGLIVGNPEGYQTPQAISAGTIAVGVKPLSVFSDKIVLRSLRVESPEITFEGGLGGNNLSKIMDNVNAAAHTAAQTDNPVSTNTTARARPSKKFEVDDLLITGAKVHVSLTNLDGKATTLSLPPIHLTDLGQNEDGITATELTRSVLDAMVTATIKAVAQAGVDKGISKGANKISKELGNLLGK
jgi:uncharacterized protein involved in outer membrane biogenesis